MLDMKSTFDGLVDRFADSDETKARILDNPIYQHVSDALAGSAEYAAMERVDEIAEDALADTPDAIANTLARATNHYQSNTTGSLVPLATESMPPLGGGQSHNPRPPSLALGFCIALVGVYPSRS